MCFGLEGDFSLKKGQIAHLDQNSGNDEIENLAFLCLDHHDEYDSSTRQSKGLALRETKIYRERLYEAVKQYFFGAYPVQDQEPVGSTEEDALFAEGELSFYLARYNDKHEEGLSVLRQISSIVGTLSEKMTLWQDDANRLLGSTPKPKLKDYNAHFSMIAEGLTEFARNLTPNANHFSALATQMMNALTRASVVASDHEIATEESFRRKLNELYVYRETLIQTLGSAGGTKEAIVAWTRGPTNYNRGRRLAVSAINQFLEKVANKIEETKEQERVLKEILEFF